MLNKLVTQCTFQTHVKRMNTLRTGPRCNIGCNIARNNCKGRHTVQISDCMQCCIVCPVLNCYLKLIDKRVIS